jgi:3-oxoacyl-[acyl-carrier protein] reductase
MPEPENKTALVTGASRGIGRATALALARAGANVLVHYGRSAHEAESLVDAIRAEGGRANAVSADLRTPDGASVLAKQAVGSKRKIDVVFANAGAAEFAPLGKITESILTSSSTSTSKGLRSK